MDHATSSVILSCLGFIVTFLATPLFAKVSRKLGVMAVDVHKLDKPRIPDMCGLAITLGIIVSASVGVAVLQVEAKPVVAFVLCISVAAAVGIADDLGSLSSRVKPALTALAAIPIVLLGAYNPYMVVPFLGATRLTIVYPILVVAAIAVLSNAINMMNPFNGAMSGTCSILSLAMVAYLLMLGRTAEMILPSALLGSLLAFHWYNRYPARVFSGNAGDLSVGAAIGALTVLGRIEVPMLIAMIPHITNAFYLLSSMGGLRERREISYRPTRLLEDGRIEAAEDGRAPITLSRLILAEGALHEYDIVNIMILMTIASSMFGFLTLTLTRP